VIPSTQDTLNKNQSDFVLVSDSRNRIDSIELRKKDVERA
jgi:hypothetical protein